MHFRTTFPQLFSHQQVFTNEISSSALLNIQPTLLSVSRWSGFIYPRMRTFSWKKRFHCLFSKKEGFAKLLVKTRSAMFVY